jgi:phosphomannomutase
MSQQAKFGIAGLRGIWGEGLNEDIVRSHIEAYALFLQKRNAKKVVLGRDSRKSGPIIKDIAIDVLTNAGIEIVDVGIAPTPTLIFLTRTTPFDGAIMLTASHNPPEYNGIKFFNKDAFYINESELDEIKSYIGSKPEKRSRSLSGENFNLNTKHIDRVVEGIDSELIRSKKFRVVIDVINGAGYKLGPTLLERLGCDVTVINEKADGNFAHMPEPLAPNLVGLGEKVKEVGADIGFALDPDADRLVLCDENGVIVFEEYTLSLAVESVLAKTPGDIVTNLSTSNTNEDLVKAVGYKNYRSRVGEMAVVQEMIKHNAIVGGEGGGGVIYPTINMCRDSITGMGLILELLAQKNQSVSELVNELPQYEFIKTKMPFEGDVQEIVDKMIKEFIEGTADIQDGLRVDFPDSSWVQLRSSNTEPIIRIWAEAKTKERAQELIERAKKNI